MNRLKQHLVYLKGPMDDAKDRGFGWRKDIKPFLWSLGIGVLDPCDKPTDAASEDDDAFAFRQSRKSLAYQSELCGDFNTAEVYYEELHNAMKPIVAWDYRMVDLCSFGILYIDRDCHMCGSYCEATHAIMQRKPIIICCKQGKHCIPDWMFSVGIHQMFFSTWDQVKQYILYVHTHPGEVETYNRWRFFDFDKVFGLIHNEAEV